MPEVPTMAQAGFPDINVKFWLGLLAPAGTPPAIIDELYANAKLAMAVPATNAALSAQGSVVMQSPQYFANRIATEVKQLAEVIKREKISLD
ncbi:Tripartite tricarboxylate transporter family receptor [compost metagenome]